MGRLSLKYMVSSFIIIIIVITLATIIPPTSTFFKILELKFLDFRFQLRELITNERSSSEIVIVEIEDDLEIPTPRDHLAKLVKALSKSGTRIIALDVLLEGGGPHDEELASAIGNARNVVIPCRLVMTNNSYKIKYAQRIFQENAFVAGFINFPLDIDGAIRRMGLIKELNDGVVPSFSLAILWKLKYQGLDHEALKREISNLIPVDKKDNFIINCQIPQKTFSIFRSRDVASGRLPDNFFKDKIVFIGGGGSQFHDNFRTPLYGTILPSKPDLSYRYMSGVEIHANALNTLLTKDFISFFPMIWNIVILVVIILGMSVLIFKCDMNNTKAISLVFLGMAIFCIISVIVFLFNQWMYVASQVFWIVSEWFIGKILDAKYQTKIRVINDRGQAI